MPAAAARTLDRQQLVAALTAARAATFAATLDLDDAQWRVPYDPGIQPTAWDLAHIAWFAEFWLLRGPHHTGSDGFVGVARPARHIGRDEHYDSARIAHRTRWEIPLWSRAELQDRLAGQLADCSAAILAGGASDADLYHARFALYHELMHVEALHWTRARLGHPAAAGLAMPRFAAAPAVAIAAGEHRLGSAEGEPGFAFDNERPGRRVALAAFTIDARPVTNGEFAAFVASGGYRRPELWPGPASTWLARTGRDLPVRWRRTPDGGFEERWFAGWRALDADAPVVHVSAYEAEAYCAHAGRRLPSAAEWEVAAPQLQWGRSVWEWTSEPFAPYPGFRPAPYTTYSAPWFHHQRELRGGAYATDPLLHDPRYRNFFLPQRTDVFAGFRTVAR